MRKLIILAAVVFSATLKMWGQDAQKPSPKDLLLAIQKSKPDTNRISLQVKLGSYYLFKPGEFKNDLDSTIDFFNQAAALSNKLHEVDWQYRILMLMGNYYSEKYDLERSKQCFISALAYYHKKGNIGEEADALRWVGDWYNDNIDRDRKIVGFYRRAISLYLQNNQPLKAANVLNSIADLDISDKHFDLAENELKQVLIQYKSLGYKSLQSTYNELSYLEYAKGNYYRAMAYASDGIKNMKASGDTAGVGFFYEAMGRCNYAVKNYTDAREWIRKSIASRRDVFQLKCTLVQLLILLNRTDEARAVLDELGKDRPDNFQNMASQYRALALYYDKINNDDLAVQYYLKISELNTKKNFPENGSNVWAVSCDNEISRIYLKNKQPAKAEKYLNNAQLIFKNAKTALDPLFLIGFYGNLYKYDVATGNYKEAVKNLEQHDRLQDSVFTADKNNKIAELDIQYQTAQKEQSIKDLHNQAALQQMRLNITLVGIVIMVVVSALFYRNYKQKQSANNIITHKNELLQRLLTEKEWLLKEVHHRVKNNLHTVICLLESQAAYLENDALKAIENSQHRIYAMSLIHQKLYQSDDIKTIDMSEYIPELVKSLEGGFDTSDQIQFKLNIALVKLDISHAIPLGLIINEAVTNSIKYAFPNKRQGEISISMLNYGDWIKLELADNGIGMPEIAGEVDSGSLGLVLMKGLSEDIDADIDFKIDNGTKITIKFKPDALDDAQSNIKSTNTKEMYI